MSQPEAGAPADLCSLIESFGSTRGEIVFQQLKKYVSSGEFRDEELSAEAMTMTFKLLLLTLDYGVTASLSNERVREIRSLCITIIKSEEFSGVAGAECIPPTLIKAVVSRASPGKIKKDDVENEVQFVESALLMLYSKFHSRRCVVRGEVGKFLQEYSLVPTRTSYLSAVLNVLNVIISGMTGVDCVLFREVLLPLHRPNGWSFWDRQTPLIGEYHKSLVRCCHSMIAKDSSLATELIDYLLSYCFPPVNQTNTAKELLLLFEIGNFLQTQKITPFSHTLLVKLMKRILESIASENAQLVQSALLFWKAPPSVFPDLLGPHLDEFMNPLLQVLFRGEPHWNPTVNKMTLLVLTSLEHASSELFEKAAAWIPETKFAELKPNLIPVPPQRVPAASVPQTLTGLAPWLSESTIPLLPNSEELSSPPSLSGLPALRQYINLVESATPKPSSTIASWESALSSDTPTLLPDLKFHNLVFGRDLGVGAFSTVRYARVVRPGAYLSGWEEVAVKIVSFETIRLHAYGGSVGREICALRKLAHPSIARLISSFRWRDGIYLVLEYGSLGDLHSYVRGSGGLCEETVRLVVGEIATAVLTVHEAGFVYGDLKPENCVITSSRHVKLADFGACRPISLEAQALLEQSKAVLQSLRSGDWKKTSETNMQFDEKISFEFPPNFEGTEAYRPPEAGQPTVLSDAWALGLTTYFLLKARLPQWAVRDEKNNSHVEFDLPVLDLGGSVELGDFLQSLLSVDLSGRSSVAEVISHPWFASVQDVRKLYSKPVPHDHLPAGSSTALSSQAPWEKRQLSKIWTAQPTDYHLHTMEWTVIEEGETERNSPFV